jgi:hypothetical protein
MFGLRSGKAAGPELPPVPQRWEYKVVAAPRRGVKAKGARTTNDRFANAMAEILNAEARQGWEYLRAESLPADEKPGFLKSSVEVYQSVLVFRREIAASGPAVAAPAAAGPALTAQRPQETPRAEPVFTAPKPHAEPVLTLGADQMAGEAPALGPATRD